jgi:predicted dehydrogenase
MFVDKNPYMRTVAVSDVTYGREGVEDDGLRFYPDYPSLFREPLDALIVCLPNHLAAEATMAGLEHELHVFCEKPPGRTVQDIAAVIEVERDHPLLKLKYGFNHRYHDSVSEAKRIIDSGQFGPIINIRGVYGKSSIISYSRGWRAERQYAGGGILLDQGIHMLDMIRLFAGDFEEVKSFVSNDYWRHDVEDNAYAILRSRSGCVAMIHSTATQWQHRFRLEVTLRDALLELTGILSGSKSYGEERLTIIPRTEGSSVGSFTESSTSYLEDNSWRTEIDEFADLIVHDRPVTNGNSRDALKVMQLVYRIYYADEQWRTMFDIDPPESTDTH